MKLVDMRVLGTRSLSGVAVQVRARAKKKKMRTMKTFYVYRLTCTHLESPTKYYYGYHAATGDPLRDGYWSSSRHVRVAIALYGKAAFRKKIVATYATREAALALEVKLHAYFNVKDNPAFFNRANQTSTKFVIADDYSPSEATRAKIVANNATRAISESHREKVARAMTGRTHSPETKAKISASKRGNTVISPEQRAKIGEASRADWAKLTPEEHQARVAKMRAALSPEIKAKRAAAQRGKVLSEAHKAKLSAAAKRRMEDPEERAKMELALSSGRGKRAGTAHTEESKQKISAARKGQKLTEETKKKISESTRGKTVGDETRNKLSTALTGRTLNDEHKTRIAIAIRKKAAARANAKRGSKKVPKTAVSVR